MAGPQLFQATGLAVGTYLTSGSCTAGVTYRGGATDAITDDGAGCLLEPGTPGLFR